MMMCKVLLGVLLINLCSFNCGVLAYSNGAPNFACGNMKPGHGFLDKKLNKSFNISVSSNVIKPGSKITVTLAAIADKKFKGFLIEAKTGSGRIGKFHPTKLGRRACDDHKGLTHKYSQPKKSATFTWDAPSNLSNSDKVIFKVTFVEEYYSYWKDHLELRVSSSSETAPAASEKDVVKRYYM